MTNLPTYNPQLVVDKDDLKCKKKNYFDFQNSSMKIFIPKFLGN